MNRSDTRLFTLPWKESVIAVVVAVTFFQKKYETAKQQSNL